MAIKSVLDIGAPLGYSETDGKEQNRRFIAGASPELIKNRLEISVGEKWHKDPIFRYETNVAIKKKLNKLCPEIESFKLNYENGIETNCNSISGVYGIGMIHNLYGVEPIYNDENWVEGTIESYSLEELSNLSEFNLESNKMFSNLMDQMDIMQREYGQIRGHLNLQGVLNVAFKLREQDIFLDMYDDEDLCHKLFAHIRKTIYTVQKAIQQRQRESGFDIDAIVTANCVVNMISKEMYEKFIMPHDIMLIGGFRSAGMHTCNWDVTPYIDSIKTIKNLSYLDMGAVSDMDRIEENFKDIRKNILISPIFLNMTFEKQKEIIDNVLDKVSIVDFSMGSLDSSVDFDKLNKLNEYILSSN